MTRQKHPDLAVYLWFNRLLKFKKLKYKLFLLAFIATHVPLLTYIAYIFLSNQHNWSYTELMVLVTATLIGTLFVLWAIHHLLKPVSHSAEALDQYLHNATIRPLPHHIDDEMGQLMRRVGYTLHTLDRRFKALENVSSYDFLTDLHNRRSAKAQLNDNTFSVGQTYLVMIDLDDFKAINDHLGHFAGDVVLKDVASEIKASFMTPDDWAARWGGDEFLLILHGDEQSIIQQLATLQENINQKSIPFENRTIKYSISLGLTGYQENQSIKDLLKQADRALLTAKNKGKNQLYQN